MALEGDHSCLCNNEQFMWFFILSLLGDPNTCSISNPNFVIYSSVVSFYLPFLVTLLLYIRIYIVLRQRRRKRILTRQSSHNVKACYKQQVWPMIKLKVTFDICHKSETSLSTPPCPLSSKLLLDIPTGPASVPLCY